METEQNYFSESNLSVFFNSRCRLSSLTPQDGLFQLPDGANDLVRLDCIKTSDELVKTFYDSKEKFQQSGFQG